MHTEKGRNGKKPEHCKTNMGKRQEDPQVIMLHDKRINTLFAYKVSAEW
jgi:hypothetical protein